MKGSRGAKASTFYASESATHETLTRELPWLSAAPEGQQSAILDMGYQLGAHGVLEFHDMLAALEADDCPAAKRPRWIRSGRAKRRSGPERVTAILCEE